MPDAIVVPGGTEEISKIMQLANREKVNIIPRGAGTNICGSSVARRGGIIIAFHRMSPKRETYPHACHHGQNTNKYLGLVVKDFV